MIHRRDFGGTLEFMRQLQPDVRNVFVISGAGVFSEQLAGSVRQLQPAHPELTFTYLSGLPTHDLEDRLSKLPPHSAAYYLAVSQDGAGQSFHPLEYLDRIAAGGQRADLLLGGFRDRPRHPGRQPLSSGRGDRSRSANSPCACFAAKRPTAFRSPRSI